MAGRGSYKTTLFDRHGPDAGIYLKAYAYAAGPTGLSVPVFIAVSQLYGLSGWRFAALMILGPAVLYLGSVKLALRLLAGSAKVVEIMVAGGSSTPYTEQYSYQQTLVMQGRLEEALQSYEAIIAEPESAVDVRIRAAELYAREAKRFDRAAELLREASRHPKCSPSEEVYSARRLADLLSGPLGQPGRALVELRRLADRYQGTNVGEHAREAIRLIKNGGPVDLYKAAESSSNEA